MLSLHQQPFSLQDFNAYMNELGDGGVAQLAPAFKECK
jgi:hypothetical protein